MTFTNKIMVFDNSKEVAKKTAEIFVNAVARKPNIILGLPTGKTFIPIYREVVRLSKKKKISFAKVRTFNLDEFYGLKIGEKGSFSNYMNKNLFDKVDIKRQNIFMLNGNARDFSKECAVYENKIKKLGGIDLQFLGLGVNGHIGFNEPGSAFGSRTRRVKLTSYTRKLNAFLFSSATSVPRYALTMGIGTILDAKKIILVATGKSKSGIVREIVRGKINKKIPASALCRHKNVTLILDKDAARLLS